jgi:hypothetical protein
MKFVMYMHREFPCVRVVNFATSKNLAVKNTIFRTEAFITTSGPLLMGRLATRLVTY